MGFPSTLSFSNSPILSIKHNTSRARDRCSCPAVISYASVPCKHMLQSQGQNSTALGKAGAHCVGNVAGPVFHWGSETSCHGQHRDKKKKLKMPVSLQRYKLSAQTELVTGTGQKDQKTRVSWGSQSCSEYSMTWIGERLNSAKQPRGSDPRPISAVGEHFTKSKSWWWAWETNSQRQLKNCKGHTGGAGERHSITNISASFCDVWQALPLQTVQDWGF